MRYKVMAIRDRVIDTYGQPIFVAQQGAAIRSFGDEIKREAEGNQLNKHPEDFDLYYLGEFDDQTGEFFCDGPPRQVAIGKDYKVS